MEIAGKKMWLRALEAAIFSGVIVFGLQAFGLLDMVIDYLKTGGVIR